jgi:hypothetical protein
VSRRSALRASDEDRDQVVDRLHKAHTEGRIGGDEFEQRVGAALEARTYGELEATVADFPASSGGSLTPPRSAAGSAVAAIRANLILILVVIAVLAVATAVLVTALAGAPPPVPR